MSAVITQFKVKVIDFGTNRKPVYIRLPISGNIISELHLFLHHLQIIADFIVRFLLSTAVYFSLTHSFGVNP